MTESILLNCGLKLLKRREEKFFNSFSLYQVFIGISFHFAILHCSHVADTLENELLWMIFASSWQVTNTILLCIKNI